MKKTMWRRRWGRRGPACRSMWPMPWSLGDGDGRRRFDKATVRRDGEGRRTDVFTSKVPLGAQCVIAAEDTVEAPSRIGRFDASALAWSHCQRHAAAWAAAAQLLSALRTRGGRGGLLEILPDGSSRESCLLPLGHDVFPRGGGAALVTPVR
ncbi:unnamed protein product [Durusdinium trenchii]|uniref:Uncharacterized protein n=2 Tax=Durusdinium trenchii TaxID=1381693 RepID=A0ABP0NAZ3_9DINO